MYGMEYSQIIHPPGCISQMKGLKRSVNYRISGLSHANRYFKNPTCDYVPTGSVKFDRLLGSNAKEDISILEKADTFILGLHVRVPSLTEIGLLRSLTVPYESTSFRSLCLIYA